MWSLSEGVEAPEKDVDVESASFSDSLPSVDDERTKPSGKAGLAFWSGNTVTRSLSARGRSKWRMTKARQRRVAWTKYSRTGFGWGTLGGVGGLISGGHGREERAKREKTNMMELRSRSYIMHATTLFAEPGAQKGTLWMRRRMVAAATSRQHSAGTMCSDS